MSPAKLVANLKGARRELPAKPSGCTTEHLRVLLDDESCTELLRHAAQQLSEGCVPGSVVEGLRVGRLVALSEPGGGIQALDVMGDTFRRLVSRTLAQQASDAFMAACASFQDASSNRAGTEALARALAFFAERVEGIGAYNHVARAAMFKGLRRDARLAP